MVVLPLFKILKIAIIRVLVAQVKLVGEYFLWTKTLLNMKHGRHGSSGFEKLPTEIFEGKILNDTTFHITKYYLPNGENSSAEDMLFHFRQFNLKPDSTAANKWIDLMFSLYFKIVLLPFCWFGTKRDK